MESKRPQHGKVNAATWEAKHHWVVLPSSFLYSRKELGRPPSLFRAFEGFT
jgi:hypothetical protein